MNFTKASFKIFISNVGNTITLFIGLTYFARILGPSVMGTYFLFWAIAGASIILIDFGVSNALEKRVSEVSNQSGLLGAAVILSIIILSVASLLICVFRPQLNEYIGASLSGLLIILLVVRQGATLSKKLLNAELRVGQTAILRLCRRLIFVALGGVLIQVGLEGAEALVIGQITGYSVIWIWAWKKQSTGISQPSKSEFKSLIEFSRYGFLIDAGGFLYNWTDILIIGFFLGQVATGAYEMSWRVAGIVMIVSNAIHLTMFPQVSRWDSIGESKKIENLLEKSIFPSLVLVIPALSGVFVLSQEVLTILFGPSYSIASDALIILLAGKLVQSIHVLFERTLSAIDRPDLTARAMGSSMIINVILNIILVPVAGLAGAAIATTVASGVNLLLHYKYLKSEIAVRIPARRLGWCVGSSILMGSLLYITKLSLTISSLLELTLFIAFGAFTYLLAIMSLGDIREDLLMGIKSII